MTLQIAADPVPLRADASGTVRVGRSRVTLDLVVEEFLAGSPPERIVEQYDALKLPDVYAVLAYYLRHRREVDAYLADRRQRAGALRGEIEGHFPSGGLRARLQERQAKERDAAAGGG
jgi:uncharacterized protein (DUF433 family)